MVRQWLVDAREAKHMTQADVARYVKISQPSYHYIETGKNNPRVSTAKRIAEALDIEWTRFFED